MGRACSVSTSYASFEADLEGSILQHTGAVDHYLETQAPKWTSSNDEHATPQRLHSLFIGDMNTSFWQAFANSRGEISMLEDSPYQMRGPCPPAVAHDAFKATQLLRSSTKRRPRLHPLQVESPLEQYLQDLQHFVDMREELDSQASSCDAAVLSVPVEQQRQLHMRTSSSGSFVRLPEHIVLEDEGGAEAAVPLAPTAIAAAAAARVSWDSSCAAVAAPAGTLVQQKELEAVPEQPKAAVAAAAAPGEEVTAAAQAAQAAVARSDAQAAAVEGGGAVVALQQQQQQQQGSAGQLPFVMEDDAEIAAQKLAARARLAELEGGEASAAAAAGALPHGKVLGGKCMSDDNGGRGLYEPGSVHSSCVLQRPRGLTGLVHVQWGGAGSDLYSLAMGLQGKGDAAMFGSAAMKLQAVRFFQSMAAGLLLCLALLPALWALQAWSGGGSATTRAWLSAKLHSYGAYLYVPFASVALLWIFRNMLMLQPPLLHFPSPELEERYLLWSNTGKLCVDRLFHVLFLVVGGCLWVRLKHTGVGGEEQAAANTRMLLAVVSMMGTGLPAVLLLLLRSVKYTQWREQLLAGSRVASILALLVMQLLLPEDCSGQLPLSMPFVALAQLMGIACMQVRLATFVPCQVLHLLVLLLKSHTQNAALHFVQIFGGGLCLPCLLLHSMEMYSRKAFLANFTSAGGKQKMV